MCFIYQYDVRRKHTKILKHEAHAKLLELISIYFFVLSNFSAIRVCCFYYLKNKY